MNTGNNPQEDQKWQALLAKSKSTFAGDDALPFGFLTSTLARIKETKERELLERIGFRAMFAAMAILVAVSGVSLGIQLQQHFDFDPSIRGFVQVDDIPIS